MIKRLKFIIFMNKDNMTSKRKHVFFPWKININLT